jgi:hypothetical protein
MLKTIALIAVAAVVLFLLFVSTRPDTFRVARSLQIKAPPEKIFPLISNLKQYNTWNPYAKKDANIKLTYSGPPEGVGAKFLFDGNKDAGKGSIEVVGSTVPSQVDMRLIMAEPFPIDNQVRYAISIKGADSEVTWSMEGSVPFVAKIAHLVMNMDKMIGADFEAGLASLKMLAEAR